MKEYYEKIKRLIRLQNDFMLGILFWDYEKSDKEHPLDDIELRHIAAEIHGTLIDIKNNMELPALDSKCKYFEKNTADPEISSVTPKPIPPLGRYIIEGEF